VLIKEQSMASFLLRLFLADVKTKATVLKRMFSLCRVQTDVLLFADHSSGYI